MQILVTLDRSHFSEAILGMVGKPARPLNERRYKRSPLRDVMGMTRSFS